MRTDLHTFFTGWFAIPSLQRQAGKIALNSRGQLADLLRDGGAGTPTHCRTRDGVRPSNGTCSDSQTVTMALQRLRLFAFAVFAGAVTTTVQAAERESLGGKARAGA
jgi:hypothetical protein